MKRITVFILALLLFWTSAQAAVVKQVKDTKVLLTISAKEKISPGSTLSSRSLDGKRKALLVVQETKGLSAIAEIVSGSVEAGDEARNLESDQTKNVLKNNKKDASPSNSQSTNWQIILGISQQTQTVELATTTPLLQGNSLLLRGSRSQPLLNYENFEWDAGIAIEQIKASGETAVGACSGTTSCSFELLGLTPSLRVGYLPFGLNSRHFLIRAGTELVLPISVTSNVVQQNGFTPLIFYSVGASTRFGIEEKDYVPLAFDIGFYQSSGVTLTRMVLSTGYGW